MVKLLKRANQFININLFWAFSYNLVMMPIVAGVFFKWDLYVSPIWSSIAMSLSSIIVVGFSHLLTCFNYDLIPVKPTAKLQQRLDDQDDSSTSNTGMSLSLMDERTQPQKMNAALITE